MELDASQKFTLERFSRVIDECDDVEELKKLSKMLLNAWATQKAATLWAIKQTLPHSGVFNND